MSNYEWNQKILERIAFALEELAKEVRESNWIQKQAFAAGICPTERYAAQHTTIDQNPVGNKTEQEQQCDLSDIPIYRYSAYYAKDHGEMEQYNASFAANVACKDAIETTITSHYGDNRLGAGAALEVIKGFGMERTMYVLAYTVQHKAWDGRISPDNKAWAMSIPVYPDSDSCGQDRNIYFVADKSHPGLINLFLNEVRKEKEKV